MSKRRAKGDFRIRAGRPTTDTRPAEGNLLAAWKDSLNIAGKKNSTFNMARSIYFKKTGKYPDSSFPDVPMNQEGWTRKVRDILPFWRDS